MANKNIILNYLKNNYCENILEIGVLNGDMAMAMIKNSVNKNVRYVGVDLFEDANDNIMRNEYLSKKPESVGRVYRRIKGVTTNFVLHKGYSIGILQNFVNTDEKFDLIFIDGGKSLETIRSDFKLCTQLLTEGGIIFLDTEHQNITHFVDNELDEFDVEKNVVDGIAELKYKSKKKNDIDVLTAFDKRFLRLYNDIFLPSLPPKTNLYVKYIKATVDERFTGFNRTKVKFVADHIKNNKNLIFFSDVDVVFLNDNILKVLDSIYQKEGEPDLLMQWNDINKDILERNIGVMLIKPTERVYELHCKYYEKTTDWIIENYGYGQLYFNYLLDNEFKDLVVKILPLEFYGGQMRGIYNIPNSILLYHATFENDIYNKYEILNYFKNIYN